jgi:thymidine phosphorylase
VGCVICGQTGDIAPADKRMYAFRDVTSTVSSIPLITASIVCKKAAEGLRALVLDCKVGRAAFMSTLDRCTELARTMVSAGSNLGITTSALVTRMDDPLGRAVGNALEVAECIALMREPDMQSEVLTLVSAQGARLLRDAGLAASIAEGEAQIARVLADGSALAKFREMVAAQGGDPAVCDAGDGFPAMARAAHVHAVRAPRAGVVAGIDAMAIAKGCMRLGAGRFREGEAIDHAVGVIFERKRGDAVAEGDPWVQVHHNGKDGVCPAEALALIESALELAAPGATVKRPGLVVGCVEFADGQAKFTPQE